MVKGKWEMAEVQTLKKFLLFFFFLGGATQISFFAYYMPPPPLRSDYLLAIWGPFRSVSLLTMLEHPSSGSPHTIWGPSDQFTCLLQRPLRSDSLLAIWGSLQISFFVYYMGTPSCQFLRLLDR